MNQLTSTYSRFWIALNDLEEALKHARAAESCDKDSLTYTAHIKCATIAFLRSVTPNGDSKQTIDKLDLAEVGLEEKHIKLIKNAKLYRDKLFAHSDADIHNVQVIVDYGTVSVLSNRIEEFIHKINLTALIQQLQEILGKFFIYDDQLKSKILSAYQDGA